MIGGTACRIAAVPHSLHLGKRSQCLRYRTCEAWVRRTNAGGDCFRRIVRPCEQRPQAQVRRIEFVPMYETVTNPAALGAQIRHLSIHIGDDLALDSERPVLEVRRPSV